jgi:hypothetical protein
MSFDCVAAHPCGGHDWLVDRLGADIGLRCQGAAGTSSWIAGRSSGDPRIHCARRPGIEPGRRPDPSGRRSIGGAERRAMNIPRTRHAGEATVPSRAPGQRGPAPRRSSRSRNRRSRRPEESAVPAALAGPAVDSGRRQHGHLRPDDPDHESVRLVHGRRRAAAELPGPGDRLLGDRGRLRRSRGQASHAHRDERAPGPSLLADRSSSTTTWHCSTC